MHLLQSYHEWHCRVMPTTNAGGHRGAAVAAAHVVAPAPTKKPVLLPAILVTMLVT